MPGEPLGLRPSAQICFSNSNAASPSIELPARTRGSPRPASPALPLRSNTARYVTTPRTTTIAVPKNTVCVIGPKGRVHVFTPEAKHVTSVNMQRSAIERRRQQGRWRMAEPEERGEFRIQVKRLVASGEDRTHDGDDAPPQPE